MPRVARKKSESGYYHIVMRGINKQDIFHDNEDRKVFLNRMKLVKAKSDYDIIAFCLMTNHVHLLIKEKEYKIGEIIKKVLSSYVYWYNGKYERVGHLFQERYKSEPIEDETYLLYCTRYICQNPLKAKMCDNIWEYEWSSSNLLLKEDESFVSCRIIKDILKERMKSFMEENEKQEFIECDIKIKYTDEKMKEKLMQALKIPSCMDIRLMTKEKKREALLKILSVEGICMRQAARITDIPLSYFRSL